MINARIRRQVDATTVKHLCQAHVEEIQRVNATAHSVNNDA